MAPHLPNLTRGCCPGRGQVMRDERLDRRVCRPHDPPCAADGHRGSSRVADRALGIDENPRRPRASLARRAESGAAAPIHRARRSRLENPQEREKMTPARLEALQGGLDSNANRRRKRTPPLTRCRECRSISPTRGNYRIASGAELRRRTDSSERGRLRGGSGAARQCADCVASTIEEGQSR